MHSDSEDSISVTSTVGSETQEFYEVEEILAEREIDGEQQYLVKWEGYPDERCTWEPVSSFQNEETVQDWEIRKTEYKQGLATPCDVEALLAKVTDWYETIQKRKLRRREKRLRLGLPVPTEEFGLEEEDDDEEEEEEEEEEEQEEENDHVDVVDPGVRGKTIIATPISKRRISPNQDIRAQREREPKKADLGESAFIAFVSEPSKQDAVVVSSHTRQPLATSVVSPVKLPADEDTQETPSPTRDVANSFVKLDKNTSLSIRKHESSNSPSQKILIGSQETRHKSTVSKPGVTKSTSTLRPRSSTFSKPKYGPKRPQMGVSGRGPARLTGSISSLKSGERSKIIGSSIFKNWGVEKRPSQRKVFQSKVSSSREAPRKANKLSTLRRYEKAARNEPAPNINSLTLFKPKSGLSLENPPLSLPSRKASFPLGPSKKASHEPLQKNTANDQTTFASVDDEGLFIPDSIEATDPVEGENNSVAQAPRMPLAQRKREHFLQRESTDVYATLFVGQDRQLVGNVGFRGLDYSGKKLFLELKAPQQLSLFCEHICTARDFREYFHNNSSDYIGTGHIVPHWSSPSTLAEMAESLKLYASAAIHFAEKFLLVIYPVDAGLEAWEFMPKQNPLPDGVVLRFAMKKPLDPLIARSNVAKRTENYGSSKDSENIDLIMRSMLDIDYDRLVKQQSQSRSDRSNNFFLLFVHVPLESRLMTRFLREHGAKVYSWDSEGAWEYFCNHVDAGVILIEGSFYDLHIIPNLARVLRKAINVFNITFSADPLAPHPHINRLFPHGYAFLITDSFLLYSPQQVARFMRWFQFQVLRVKQPGTWKLCTRPDICDYLLSIIEARNVEEGHVYMQIYESIWHILSDDLLTHDRLSSPTTHESPIHCMSDQASNYNLTLGKESAANTNKTQTQPFDEDPIARNDATLIEWFAGWAMTQLEHFRRFQIVSAVRGKKGMAEQREFASRWNHVEILTPEKAFERLEVAKWEGDRERGKEKKKKEEEEEGKRSGGSGEGSKDQGKQ